MITYQKSKTMKQREPVEPFTVDIQRLKKNEPCNQKVGKSLDHTSTDQDYIQNNTNIKKGQNTPT